MSKVKNTASKAVKPQADDQQFDQRFDARRFVALRNLCVVLFLFSGVFKEWANEFIDGMKKAKKKNEFVKERVRTRHKCHEEWLPVNTAKVVVPAKLLALTQEDDETFTLNFIIPEDPAPKNVGEILMSLSPTCRRIVNDFLRLRVKFDVLYRFINRPDVRDRVETDVLNAFTRYGSQRNKILSDNQGSIYNAYSNNAATLSLQYDGDLEGHLDCFAIDVIDRFEASRNIQISSWINGCCRMECVTYLAKKIKKERNEKQDFDLKLSGDATTTLTENTVDPYVKTPEEIAIKEELRAKINKVIAVVSQNPRAAVNLSLLCEHLGFEIENGQLCESPRGPKTFAAIGEERGVSPQAVQGRVKSAMRDLAERLSAC